MISSLRGPVIDIGLNSAVVECGGVGYLFSATPQTLAELSRGEEATVLTLLIVREASTDSKMQQAGICLVPCSGYLGLGRALPLPCSPCLTPPTSHRL